MLLRDADQIKTLTTEKVEMLQRAMRILVRLNVDYPGDLRSVFGQAEVYRMLQRWSEARAKYEEFVASPQGRNFPGAYEGLGEVFLASKYHRQALPKFERARQLNANSIRAWKGIAECQLGLRRFEDAYTATIEARKRDPNDVAALKLAAQVALRWNDLKPEKAEWIDDGLRSCNRALSILRDQWAQDPRDTLALKDMVAFCALIKDLTLSQITAAPELQPEMALRLVEARQSEAWFQQMLSDHESLQVIEHALTTAPGNVRLLEKAAQLQKMLNLDDDALATARKLLEVDPGSVFAQRLIADLTQPPASPPRSAPTPTASAAGASR